MMRKRWCEKFLLNPWIFKQEVFPNANPFFRVVCECICKVITYYANPSPTYRPFAHNESR